MKDWRLHLRMKWMDFKFAVKVFFIRYGTTAKKFKDHTLSELEEMGLGDCPTKKIS